MQIFNTLGRAPTPFVPVVERKVGIYVCGATVQAHPHLGHGRSAVAFDVIRRYLIWRGYEVTYVRNVTDVDDKIIAAAQQRGISTDAVVAESYETFAAAEDALGVLRPDVEPRATDHIPEMIEIISTLVDKGLAYAANGDVYFRVRALPDYGKLSGRDIDDLLSGARVEVGDVKEDPLDFAMWKAAKPGEPTWDSPWGPGRPGWHIECSAMARRYLGDTVDIHGGGTDLIFPHHENEIAQSESATGKPFARVWAHNGMLTLGGEKMAKSTGHVIGLTEAVASYDPMAVRLFYLRAHYRSLLEYAPSLLEDAVASYERLTGFVRRAVDHVGGPPDPVTMERFIAAMDDDFNTPVALSVLFDAVREANRALDLGDDAGGLAAAAIEILEVLGLVPSEGRDLDDLADAIQEAVVALLGSGAPAVPASTEENLAALVEAREAARQAKDWALSDAIRDGLADIGIVIEDTADGVRWHRK